MLMHHPRSCMHNNNTSPLLLLLLLLLCQPYLQSRSGVARLWMWLTSCLLSRATQ
jgi:hypothetical protein